MTMPPAEMGKVARSEKRQAGEAIMMSLLIALSLSVLSIASSMVFARLGQAPRAFVPVATAVVTLASAWLIYRGRLIAGASFSLIALGTAFLFFVTQFTGIGLLGAIVFTLVAITLIARTFPSPINAYSLLLAILAGVLILLLDLYWPWERRESLPEGTLPIVLASLSAGLLVLAYGFRRIRDYSLRQKLVSAFLVVSLIPLAIAVFASTRSARIRHTEEINSRLLAAADHTSASVDRFIGQNLIDIGNEASALEITGYFRMAPELRAQTRPEEIVIGLLESYYGKDADYIHSYALLDPHGAVLLQYPQDSPQVDEANRDYFVEAVESREPYVSPVEFSPVSGGPFLYFSASIHDPLERLVGVLRLRYRSAVLQQFVEGGSDSAATGSYTALLDENLLILANGADPKSNYQLVAPIESAEYERLQAALRLPSVQQSNLSLDLPEFSSGLDVVQSGAEPLKSFAEDNIQDGQDRAVKAAASSTQVQPWLVISVQPEELFLAPIEDQTRSTIVVALVIAIIVTLVAILFAQLLTRPIDRLQEAASRVAQGDLSIRVKVDTEDEIGWLSQTFNTMTAKLEDTLHTMEQRVASRTNALATSAEVGRRISTILDQNLLLAEVADIVQSSFDYYQVQIYLSDEDGSLHLVSGTGEPGRVMLEQEHRIGIGEGLVGRAAARNSVVLVSAVEEDPGWLPNPLLENTKSEISVPIVAGDIVLGVLDVQEDTVNGLKEQDADSLLAIANQVAIALQNARSYSRIQRQAETRARINEINRIIQSTTDAESAMKVTIRELARTVGAASSSVWLDVSPDSKDGKPVGMTEEDTATGSEGTEGLV
jgi:HAMP domain-containing protein